MTDEPVRRGTPNPDRPRLPDALEEIFLPIDKKSAEAYTAIEIGMERIDSLLDEGGVVMHAVDASDTLVFKLKVARDVGRKLK